MLVLSQVAVNEREMQILFCYNLFCLKLKLQCSLCANIRAQNNSRSTNNVRPERGLDRSNSRLAGHFDRSFLDANIL